MNERTLYARLGGTAGIKAIVDDVVALHLDNPVIQARFRPYLDDPGKVESVKKHTCDFLAAGGGGPVEYTGRSMREAHRGMNISPAEYMAAVDDILAALGKHGVDEATRRDVLAIAYGLKDEILHV